MSAQGLLESWTIGRIIGDMRYFYTFAFVILSIATFATPSYAAYTKSGDSIVVNEVEPINDDLYLGGQTIDIRGVINGDVFCGGQSINIDASIDGDVFCGGQTIRMAGTVSGDVRLGGQVIEINNSISRNVTIFGQSLNLGEIGSIGRNLTFAGQSVDVRGNVVQDLYGASQNINVAGSVGRNVNLDVESLTLASAAFIGGDLTYTSEQTASLAAGAAVIGNTQRNEPEYPRREQRERHERSFLADWSGNVIFSFLSSFAVAGLLLWLMPQLIHKTVAAMRTNPLKSIGAGFLILIGGAVVPLLILFTIIGFKVSLIIWLLWIVDLLIAPILAGLATSFYLSDRVLPTKVRRMRYFIPIGLFVYVAVTKIPVLGWFLGLLGLLWGLGGVAATVISWRRTF